MGINTPNGGNDDLKLIMERLSDEKRDELLEMLKQDKELREYKKEGTSEKLINYELKYFDEIFKEVDKMKKSVEESNPSNNLFTSTFDLIDYEIKRTARDFKSKNDEWNSNKNITCSDIKTDIQNFLMHPAFRTKGWINQLMILLSYSRNQSLKDQMKEHGIDSSLLESICSNVTKMLDGINMEVIVPTVLVDKFDNNLHDYENGDIWIDKFFPELWRGNYPGMIFDIVNVGYEIKDEEGNIIKFKKPYVQF